MDKKNTYLHYGQIEDFTKLKIMTAPLKGTILVVDDDEAILLTINQLLTTNGYEVITAKNGREALEKAQILQPQLILLDVILPDIPGLEVLQQIKSNPETQNCFVVLMSSFLFSKDEQSVSIEAGADGYILKPFQNQELVTRIDTFMRLKTTLDKLKKSEEKHRFLFENMTQGVIYHAPTGEVIEANEAAASILGLSMNQLLGKTPFDPRWKAIHEDGSDYPGETHPAMITLKTGKAVRNSVMGVFVPEENQYRWVIINATPHFMNDGCTLLRVTCTLEDITAQKLADSQLRHTTDLLQYIIQHDPNAIAVHDTSLNFVYVSQRFLHENKIGNLDIIGKNLYEVFSNFPQKWKEIFQRAMQGEIVKSEDDYFVRDDGSLVYVSWECRPWYVKDDEIGGIVLYSENITKRKQVELALLESERQLSSLIENLPGFVYRCLFDENWTMLYLSSQCKTITGYDPDDFILNHSLTFNDIIVKEFQPEVFKKWETAVRDKRMFEMEYPVLTAGGEKKWLWERGTGVYNDAGELLFLEGYIEDVTEKVKAEAELRESEEKYRHITENISDVIWTADLNFKTTYVTPSIEKLIGEPAEKHLSRLMEEKMPPDSLQKIIEIFSEEMEKEKDPDSDPNRSRQFEVEHYHANGSLLWLSFHVSIIRDKNGKPVGFQGVTRDITNQKKIETELRESEERYRLILDNSLDSVLLTSPDGSVYSANKAACEMFGMTEEEICHAGRNGLVDLDDPNLPKFSDEREKTGKAKGELRFKRKDGSIFPAEISSALFTNSKGETRNSLIIRDISERKKAENEIKRKVDELQKTRQASLKLIEDLTEEIEKRKQYEKELKQSESRFAIAFNASPAPLVISEIDTGIFINVNNRWIEMLGYSKEEQIGKTSKEVGIWRNPSERDRIIQFLQKNGFFKDEYIEFNTKSGDEILALWSAETIELGGKKLMLSMIHDITQRVKAETELRELKNNLEIEVQKKTQELRERISELERFHEATIEREFRIKELRDEIERLKRT